MRFNKARKRLNHELKWVARGESPSRALGCLYQTFSMTLAECDDDAEIMEWTTKMISRCTEWQALIVSPEAIARALIESAEEIRHLGRKIEIEKQGDGGANHEV